MAHEIENNEMFSVRETPWHKQGVVLDNPPSTIEAIRAAKLDFLVEKVPTVLHPTHAQDLIETGHYATVRWDGDGNPIILGNVSERYTVIQNEKAFEVFDRVLLPEGYTYTTAGAIKRGKKVWILAEAPEHMTVGDDKVMKYVLLVTSHDGTMNHRLMPTAIRVVCNNTLTWALQRGTEDGFSIRHTGNAEDKLNLAADALKWAEGDFNEARDIWSRMYELRIEPAAAIHYFERVMPELKKRGDSPTWRKYFDAIADSFMYGPGNRGETLWHAYQAITEYVDHRRNTAPERAVDYAIFGRGGKIKRDALSVAHEIIADRVVFPTPQLVTN